MSGDVGCVNVEREFVGGSTLRDSNKPHPQISSVNKNIMCLNFLSKYNESLRIISIKFISVIIAEQMTRLQATTHKRFFKF